MPDRGPNSEFVNRRELVKKYGGSEWRLMEGEWIQTVETDRGELFYKLKELPSAAELNAWVRERYHQPLGVVLSVAFEELKSLERRLPEGHPLTKPTKEMFLQIKEPILLPQMKEVRVFMLQNRINTPALLKLDIVERMTLARDALEELIKTPYSKEVQDYLDRVVAIVQSLAVDTLADK